MSSTSSPTTGMREKPERRNRLIAWRQTRSSSMATMSVRGTMTSRVIVSPSSKTEWIISRSPASMRAESRARSTRSRSSPSVSNGPSRKPFPGVTALVRAMSRRENGPRTRRTHTAVGAAASATRVLCCIPRVPGETPTTAKEMSAMIAMATRNGLAVPST